MKKAAYQPEVLTCPLRTSMSLQLFRSNCSCIFLMATDLRILRMAIHAPLKVFCHEHENDQLNY